MSSDALVYALAALSSGVRQILGDELRETPREELVSVLATTFRGPEELKAALEEAFERSLQGLVVGLKQAWLLMETGGEHDYCEAFGERVRADFVAEQEIEGRLFIDFLDGFFLDFDTAADSAAAALGLDDGDGEAARLFGALLDAGVGGEGAEQVAARATETVRRTFIEAAGLEEEHPVVRLGCWRDLLADGLHYHFTEAARTHPTWSRYLEQFSPEGLDREEMRAISRRDEQAQQRLALVRGLEARRSSYQERFGDILPNREWLFDIADRLEETEENVESDLLKGRTIAAQDLPKIVTAGVKKVHAALGTSAIGRLGDVLTAVGPGVKDVLRRARRDFRRCHWSGEEYGEAALQLAGAMLPLAGPGGAQRYYREAAAFGGDRAACEFGLFLTELLSAEYGPALEHLRRAVELAPDRFAPFDFERYPPEALLGAGGGGPTFLVSPPDGEPAVVKVLWDPVSLVDPRPGLRPLAMVHKGGVAGLPRLLHLGVHSKEYAFVTSAFVEGDDLEDFREARGGEVPPSLTATIGAMVAGRLAGLHGAGFVHRALKPGNVRIGAGEEGLEVTLLDACVPSVLLTAPGRVPHTRRLLAWSRAGRSIAEQFAWYTAPEVVRGGLEAATPASDLYALGAILYRLATGAPPQEPAADALPRGLRDVVMALLARDPAGRPGSAQEVEERLLAAAEAPEEDEPDSPRLGGSTSAVLEAIAPTADPFADLGAPFGHGAPVDPFAATFRSPAPGGAPFAPPPPGSAPGLDDPFAPPAGARDPFAPRGRAPAPLPGDDPFAPPPGADPFAPPPGETKRPAAREADPFARPPGDPFAPSDDGLGDPFAPPAPGADPFAPGAGVDPFAPAGGADPFAPGGQGADPFGGATDPFGGPGVADPFGGAGGADPFGGPGVADPFGGAGPDPFGGAGGPDPFGGPGDPFGGPGGGDPFGGLGSDDPFGAPAGLADPFAPDGDDPFAAPGHDPFGGGAGDPFGAPAGGPFGGPDPFSGGSAVDEDEPEALDPSEALALLEGLLGPSSSKKAPPKPQPKARPPGRAPRPGAPPADPFGAPAPFGAPPGGAAGFMLSGDPDADPFAGSPDPFAQAANADPFAQSAQGFDPFAAAAMGGLGDSADPFAAAASADPFAPPPNASTSPAGLWLSSEMEAPLSEADLADEPPRRAPPPAAARRKPKGDGATYGVVISGLSLKSKKDAAIEVIMQVKGCSAAEAHDMCRSPVVPVLKAASKDEADRAEELFKEAKINVRVTSKKKRR